MDIAFHLFGKVYTLCFSVAMGSKLSCLVVLFFKKKKRKERNKGRKQEREKKRRGGTKAADCH